MTERDVASVLVVTPVRNAVETIDETIFSVLGQCGDFALRYHVQDGASDDGTVERLARWDALLRSGVLPLGMRHLTFSYSSSKDTGMYQAINRGFAVDQSSAIMGWINADDRLQPGAIATVVALFQENKAVQWVGGRHHYCEEGGMPVATLEARAYSRDLLALGLYEGRKLFFLQQEGIFWRRSLWNNAGGNVDESLRLAGDFELWRRFAVHADYVSVDAALGCFRIRPGQATSDLAKYNAEIDGIIGAVAAEREAAWASAVAGEGPTRTGPVAHYDGTARVWRIANQFACGLPTSPVLGGSSRIKAALKRLLAI